jgi:hypothetical protein
MLMYLEPFKAAAAEAAVVELYLRLLAGKHPALQKYAHQKRLEDIETELVVLFDGSLSVEEKETLRLCRQLRNKVLHTDFCAARGKLNELGIEAASGGVVKIDIPEASIAAISQKIRDVRAGTEGTLVSDTSSTGDIGVFGWFLEAGSAGDFEKARNVFKGAAAIVERLAGLSQD